MGFNIPMNTQAGMSSNSLGSLMGGASTAPTQQTAPPPQQVQQPFVQQQQPVMQQQQPVMQQPVMQQPVMQQQTPVPIRNASQGGVILKKGQKSALMNNGQPLSVVKLCLGWDLKNRACDLDASVFLLGADRRIVGDDWFVFYGQPTSPDGSVQHSGDSDGTGTGDDEVITMNLNQMSQQIQRISCVITIDEALERGQNFSDVANAYVRIVDGATNKELMYYQLDQYYSNVTSMIVCELYRHNGQWKFSAVGDGVAQDLAGLCAMYGVNVAG